MNKVITIIQKEWAEVFKNRMVLFTVIFMPLLFTALPLIILYSTGGSASGNLTSEMPPQFTQLCPQGLSGSECFQVFMVSEFMILFMMMPLIIPVNIAAYSIVGEKTTHSLEPLLATPISTLELLLGKSLASVIPAILATYTAFLLFAAAAWIITPNRQLLGALLDARWLIAVFLVGPLMAILAVTVSVMVSSRVNDPRVAEQISMVVIIPVLAVFFGQIAGLFILNQQIILVAAAILVVLDAIMFYLAIQFFQRETILTRWK